MTKWSLTSSLKAQEPLKEPWFKNTGSETRTRNLGIVDGYFDDNANLTNFVDNGQILTV